MSDLKKINWIASYPKSGNTWVRIFLINLLNPHLEQLDINSLSHIKTASQRNLFDEYSGIESCDLSDKEIEEIRPKVYEIISKNHQAPFFLKIHDALKIVNKNELLISKKASRGIIYIVRNPLDVAVSYAHFKNVSFNQIINEMNNSENYLFKLNTGIGSQLPQRLLSWSEHAASWIDQNEVPVKIIRYEDLISNTFKIFKEIVTFSGLNHTDLEIEQAIEKSEFKKLQEQEIVVGYRDKHPETKLFFRNGKEGDGRQFLSKLEMNNIIKSHKRMMERFNYLN